MNNNPVSYTDPEGDLAFLIPFIPAITDAVIIGTATAVTYFTVDNVVNQMKAKQEARSEGSSSSEGGKAKGKEGKIEFLMLAYPIRLLLIHRVQQ
jgi:hypothetical protein